MTEGDIDLAPCHVAKVMASLAGPGSAPITGRIFGLMGNRVTVSERWANGPGADMPDGWIAEDLDGILPGLVESAAPNANPMGHRGTMPDK